MITCAHAMIHPSYGQSFQIELIASVQPCLMLHACGRARDCYVILGLQMLKPWYSHPACKLQRIICSRVMYRCLWTMGLKLR